MDEFCKAALDHNACDLHTRAHKVGCSRGPEAGVWDVEELVAQAGKHKACAYFASRALLENASIVFVPYSYLLDPRIQRSAGLAGRFSRHITHHLTPYHTTRHSSDCIDTHVFISRMYR